MSLCMCICLFLCFDIESIVGYRIIWHNSLMKFNNFLLNSRHSTDREVALMMLMAYLSYMLAEVGFKNFNNVLWIQSTIVTNLMLMHLLLLQLSYLSGILTVFFCGIVMSHYTWHNVTQSSRITTKYVF